MTIHKKGDIVEADFADQAGGARERGVFSMKEVRQKQMLALIAQRGSITMEELQHIFGTSMNTIRSDVAKLAASGAVEKIYGGVRILSTQEVPLFTHRSDLHADAKRRIAQFAQTLIQEGDTLYIDPGTTTMHLMDYLSPARHVTIITGNLSILSRAQAFPNVELIVLPGLLNRRTNSVADVSTLEFLSRYRCAKAFLGASGVSPTGKLNVSTYMEYELKKLAMQQSLHTFLLADGSKFGKESLMAYGSISDLEEIITDGSCPDFARELCAREGVRLTIADDRK